MIDATSRMILQNLLRRESRGLLQYVSEAFPWITPEEKEALATLQKLIKEEQDGLGAVARFLTRNHVVPAPLGSYPMSYTTINFVSLDHLLPLLADLQRRRIAEIENDLGRIQEGEAKKQLAAYLSLKRGHLATLEKMVEAAGLAEKSLAEK